MDKSQNYQINYCECLKGGSHTGQMANYVNLDFQSKDDVVKCSVCIEQSVKKSGFKPMKSFLLEIKEKINKLQNDQNVEEILKLIKQQQTKTMEDFKQFSLKCQESLKSLQKGISSIFESLQTSMSNKSLNNSEIQAFIDEFFELELNMEETQNKLYRLLTINPTEEFKETIKFDTLQFNLKVYQAEVDEALKQRYSAITSQMDDLKNLVEVNYQETDIFKPQYLVQRSFVNNLKSLNVGIVNSYTVKSVGAILVHRFALLDKPLFGKPIKTAFSFQIQQLYTGNWIAVGACVKDVVVQNNFTFNDIERLGHGAYLISSNGGCWSNHDDNFNNQLKSTFGFVKNDTIHCEFNPETESIMFKNGRTHTTFQLRVNEDEVQKLHACVVFLQLGDEVQFINVI